MAKDPAFLFYPKDFMTGTQFMTDEQVGKYIRLLMAQHQHGRLSEKQVIFICKSYDNEVLIKFQKDDDGLYFNERLEKEILKRKAFSESRSKNKSGKTKDMIITSKSYDNHMVNVNVNVNEDVNIIKKEAKIEIEVWPTFEDFWILYDKKRGDKVKVKKKWDNLDYEDKCRIMHFIPDYKISQPDKQFRKDPETFLNNKSWNDEIVWRNPIKESKVVKLGNMLDQLNELTRIQNEQ